MQKKMKTPELLPAGLLCVVAAGGSAVFVK